MASPLDPAQVRKAVDALMAHLAKERAGKKSLFEEEDMFSLVVALAKVPAHGSVKAHRIPLPHPLWQLEGSEICLLVKDVAGEGSKEAKARLAAGEACGVAKVIGLSKLKTNFVPHEAKRRLCASYDLFLADERILPLLPPLLGKTFFKKKKHPIPVDLEGPKRDWAAAIRRATAATYLYLGDGACSAVRVGRSGQAAEAVAANAAAAAAAVAALFSGKEGQKDGWASIRALYLKTNASVALPIYTSLPLATRAAAEGGEAAEAAPAPARKQPKAAVAAARKQPKTEEDEPAVAAVAAVAAPARKSKPAAPAAATGGIEKAGRKRSAAEEPAPPPKRAAKPRRAA